MYMYIVHQFLIHHICGNRSQLKSKTLFNIVEAPLKNGWTLMSVLYDDVQMDQ